jgi:hypothetical protein
MTRLREHTWGKLLLALLTVTFLLAALPALAQQITGVPGSPDATTTISGKQLLPPDLLAGLYCLCLSTGPVPVPF